MTDYPEWLVDRVALKCYGFKLNTGWPVDTPEWVKEAYRAEARDILDVLGFKESSTRGILSASGRFVYVPSPYNLDRDGIKTYSHWTAQTEWHEVEES